MKKYFFAVLATISLNLCAQINIAWETNLGGSDDESNSFIQQTSDGGYIVAGGSRSDDGDVGGNNGFIDFWVVKLDGSGSMVWETNLGGSGHDWVAGIDQTTDGGYILAGSTESNDGDVGNNYGNFDIWVVKLDANGQLVWERNYGGTSYELGNSVAQTVDGGYIVAGSSNGAYGDVGDNNGSGDFWVLKLNSVGDIVWENNYGGSHLDEAESIEQTADGGYIVAGVSFSSNGDVGGHSGTTDYSDAWIVKLDASGELVWETHQGGVDHDGTSSIKQTSDGGYIVAGYTFSDVVGIEVADCWVFKLNATGDLEWIDNFGGSLGDGARAIEQTTDGGFIISGVANSNDGDVGQNNGLADMWILKLSEFGILLWETNFGGSLGDGATAIEQTTDGGFIISGFSKSNDGDVGGNNGLFDIWVVKVGASLSIDDSSSKNIVLHPNPTENVFTIDNVLEPIKRVEIIDAQGRLILTNSNIYDYTIDVSSLQPAMYIINLYTSNEVYTQKIIKK